MELSDTCAEAPGGWKSDLDSLRKETVEGTGSRQQARSPEYP